MEERWGSEVWGYGRDRSPVIRVTKTKLAQSIDRKISRVRCPFEHDEHESARCWVGPKYAFASICGGGQPKQCQHPLHALQRPTGQGWSSCRYVVYLFLD